MARRPARRFVEFLHARVKSGAVFISKTQAKEIGRACGVRVPQDYALFDTLEDVTLDFPPPFVFKATHLSSRRGVYPITDAKDARYLVSFQHKWLSLDEIRENVTAALAEKPPRPNKFIVEEFVRGANEGIPIDYKMYTFGGEVLFTVQVNRNLDPPAMCFFGRHMRPLTLGREVYSPEIEIQLGEPKVPENYYEMERVARKVAKHLQSPFVRVDVYTNGIDVFLGEITTLPGAPYYGGTMFRFLPSFDLYLGNAWRHANEALQIPIPTIDEDPPCFAKEREIMSGRLESSLLKKITHFKHELRRANAKLSSAVQESSTTQRSAEEVEELRSDAVAARRACVEAERALNQMLRSTSWRTTAPLRWIASRVRGLGAFGRTGWRRNRIDG